MKRNLYFFISALVYIWDNFFLHFLTIIGHKKSIHSVLYFHDIKDPIRFQKFLDLLIKRHQKVLPLSQFTDHGRSLSLTFDDGFQSLLEKAIPYMNLRELPFTIFVPGESWGTVCPWLIGTGHEDENCRIMTSEEIKRLDRSPLVSIGSHGNTHRPLTSITIEEAKVELESSKKNLEKLVNHSIDFFSFPHGSFNNQIVREANKTGYKEVYSVEPKIYSHEKYLQYRFKIESSDGPLTLFLKASGSYRWLGSLKKILKRE